MRLSDFEAMVRRLAADVPPEFMEGVVEIVVSPRTVAHATWGEIFTLGECIPVVSDPDSDRKVHSRVVLYHGSFSALALNSVEFDWAEEARETLWHELRHHLEWRAGEPALEAFDRAAEQNFARQEGESFEPTFYLDGETDEPGVYQVDDDFFLERVVRQTPAEVPFEWRGKRYRLAVPKEATLPAFLTVDGVESPPPGDLVVVLRRRPSLVDLFRRPALYQATIRVESAGD